MHEMGICLELFASLRDVMKENGITALSSVTLTLGKASMVVPRYMKDCWEIARDGTEFASTELKIVETPAHGRCLECGFVFDIEKFDRKCPKCGAVDSFVPLDGKECEITEIEAA